VSTTQQLLDALSAKPGDYVEAIELVRDGMVESRHRAIGALVGPDGKLVDHLGSAKRLIYPRSAVKPLQVVAMRRAGLLLGGAQLAITAASHQATKAHVELVRQVLADAGLDETALQCPTAWPGNPAARAEATEPARVYFNCSGKHAGFLAASKVAGWGTDDYLSAEHPLQVLVRVVLEEFMGEAIVHSTIDGCGAPLHTCTVEGLARAFGNLATKETELSRAMLENPWAVGDQDTPDAVLMRAGYVAKLGAEGVLGIGTPDGHGIAIKIADGSHRASALVAIGLMRKNGLLTRNGFDFLWNGLAPQVLGGGSVVGEFRLA
jgi:L-asparaginase II